MNKDECQGIRVISHLAKKCVGLHLRITLVKKKCPPSMWYVDDDFADDFGVTPWSKKSKFDMEENLFWVFHKSMGVG